jgi:hypothetical protein
MRLQNLPFWPFQYYYVILITHNIFVGKELGTFWVIFGKIGSILGQIGIPKLHKIRYRIIRVLCINAYFTVDVSEVRMTIPASSLV